MSKQSKTKTIPVTLEDDAEALRERVEESTKEEPGFAKTGAIRALAFDHDGKFGYVVYELEIPNSVVERYCTKRHSPDSKNGAIMRSIGVLTKVDANGIKPTLSGNLLANGEDEQ